MIRDDTAKLVDTLLVAWRDAWRILHGPRPIATSLDVRTVAIPRDDPEAAEWARRRTPPLAHVAARSPRRHHHHPWRADRELADLAGSCDLLGIATSDGADLEALLHRTADQGPDRPLTVTFRPPGTDLEAHAEAVHEARTLLTGLTSSLPLTRLTVTDADACARAVTA